MVPLKKIDSAPQEFWRYSAGGRRERARARRPPCSKMLENDLERQETARKQPENSPTATRKQPEKCPKKHFKKSAIRRPKLGDEESQRNLESCTAGEFFFGFMH